ncbi:hypothetical protein CBM2615_A50079 [Cupriavidus taiwanensis]|uniref:Uncharacterized protein n=1 Tax=Cupriavidus taiwanensis TaxID=164546 RepID=A0A976AY72_9BURK|nr:hypothetical protein CBM2615_A50079 [Cupriavidus taiwanensis]SOZ59984.1 hypothetical protein CBM2614_A50078 [Cupriavidus taiwanensis]SOZ63051.1 hypothetical protein CBM2613_A40078 [Cupriavidus taiwanensis]SPA06456.1 hypothetical protein CBM2625_A40077 [Cupriavidus taiwanensis]
MVMQRPAKPCTTVRFRIPASIFLPRRIAPGAPAHARTISPLSFFHAPVIGLRMTAARCAARALTGMPQRFRTPVYPQWINGSESGNVARQARRPACNPCRQLAAPPCTGFHGVTLREAV